MEYDFEIKKVIKKIKAMKAKLVCLQFPEGLKPKALEIAEKIEKETNAKCLIWLGSCYGSCDLPQINNVKPKIDLLVHFGHAKFKK
ncbi:MAG: diphthamide synthesis protein [Candidatus Pacearchaeota archaeon]